VFDQVLQKKFEIFFLSSKISWFTYLLKQ
jgi:hypothetical protein